MAPANGSENILDSEDMRKLFISKIPTDATDEDLKSLFEGLCGGSITELVVIRKDNAKSHFGFFTFESSFLVDEVIYKEKELVLNKATLEVNRACPKNEYITGAHHKTKKLFLGGVPKTGLTEEDIKGYFDGLHDPKYGIIESVQFIKVKDESGNKTEENKGFGFVMVSSEHLADTMAIQHAQFDFGEHKLRLRKSDKDKQNGQGGQRGGRGGRGGYVARGGHYGGSYNGYSYDGYGGGYGNWDYYSAYGMYPQYGVSSAVRGRGAGGKGTRGKRFAPYAKKT